MGYLGGIKKTVYWHGFGLKNCPGANGPLFELWIQKNLRNVERTWFAIALHCRAFSRQIKRLALVVELSNECETLKGIRNELNSFKTIRFELEKKRSKQCYGKGSRTVGVGWMSRSRSRLSFACIQHIFTEYYSAYILSWFLGNCCELQFVGNKVRIVGKAAEESTAPLAYH